MSLSNHGRENAHCIIVSIDRERAYWKDHYAALPRAQESRGFESYWPLLEQAYLVYLRHPGTSRAQGGQLYAASKEALAWRLDPPQAQSLFARVMDRIHRATTRLEFAA
ncbi:MAG: hypothetical protein ABW178_04210 [Pseudoxanthomonas sp.]